LRNEASFLQNRDFGDGKQNFVSLLVAKQAKHLFKWSSFFDHRVKVTTLFAMFKQLQKEPTFHAQKPEKRSQYIA
jgi:hypothetical protein